jgi:hypothetical protein
LTNIVLCDTIVYMSVNYYGMQIDSVSGTEYLGKPLPVMDLELFRSDYESGRRYGVDTLLKLLIVTRVR